MSAAAALANERVWADKAVATEAERKYFESLSGAKINVSSAVPNSVLERLQTVEKNNASLLEVYNDLRAKAAESELRIKELERRLLALAPLGSAAAAAAAAPAEAAAAAPAPAAADKSDDDDGVDLFASDDESEDEEAANLREKRLAEYASKKAKKPALIAKSNIILDIKPWDDETDMAAMETEVRKIEMDGLLWGASKLVPIAYGIKKLQVSCVVEDDKVSLDLLTEQLEAIEDFIQSVDIAAFNKI